jgi:hypothetical protein
MRGALSCILAWSGVLLLGSLWFTFGMGYLDFDTIPFMLLCTLCIALSAAGLATERWGWLPFWAAVTLHGLLPFASWHAVYGMGHGAGGLWALTLGLGAWMALIMACLMVAAALWSRR